MYLICIFSKISSYLLNILFLCVSANKKFAVSVLVEYIRSLMDNKITVEHFLYELLINCLVINKMYYQLHQMVQYHIFIDSKPLVILNMYLIIFKFLRSLIFIVIMY